MRLSNVDLQTMSSLGDHIDHSETQLSLPQLADL